MRRFLVKPEQISGKRVSILGDQVKHLRQVLRLKSGEKVIVLDGLGASYLVALEKVTEDIVQGEMLEKIKLDSEAPLEITLVQSVLKGEKMDWVVQKATELGVNRIIPLSSERTVVKISASKAEERRKRWEKIAQEAVKQCGRLLVPQIETIQTWEEVRAKFVQYHLVLLPWEEEKTQGLKKVLETVSPQKVLFIVGPEGGFSGQEAQKAQLEGACPVSLGPRILRAETASLAMLSILMYKLGDLG